MAIYHLDVKIIGRTSGRDATAASAYRAAEKIKDDRTGLIHNYLSRKNDVLAKDVFMPPNSDWQPTRSELWNAVEVKNKRKDSQTAREVEIALPFELSDDERWNLISDFSKALVSRYEVAADAVIHAPRGDNKNYHGHILLTTNRIERNAVGGKNRDMNSREELEHIRGMWADFTNQALSRAGHNVRIDHRTLKEQGIDREATQHEGVSATALERKGFRTRVREENLRRKAQEQERQDIKRAIAAVSVDIQKLQQEKAEVEAELNAKKLKQRHYQERYEILDEIRKLKREKNFDWKKYWEDWKKLRLEFNLLAAEQLREKLKLNAEIDAQRQASEEAQKKQKPQEVVKSFFEVCKNGTPDEIRKAIRVQRETEKGVMQVIESSGEFVEGQTGLMIAAQFNPEPKVLQILLDNWSDREAKDSRGTNALMYAAEFNPNPEVVDLLLKFGTIEYLYATDSLGRNAAFYAANNPNIEVANKIRAAGIKIVEPIPVPQIELPPTSPIGEQEDGEEESIDVYEPSIEEVPITPKNMNVGDARAVWDAIQQNIQGGEATHPARDIRYAISRMADFSENKSVPERQAKEILEAFELSKLSAREARKRESLGR